MQISTVVNSIVILTIVATAPAATASAEDETPDWDMALIPIFAPVDPVPGAFGSRWETELYVVNSFQFPVELFQGNSPECRTDPCPPPPTIPPGETTRLSLIPLSENPSVMVSFPPAAEEDVWFHLELLEHESGSWTVVPVVREREFKRQKFIFPWIRAREEQRVLLRLYGMHDVPGHRLAVQVRDRDGQMLSDQLVELIVPERITIYRRGFYDGAAYASVRIPRSSGPITIEVTSDVDFPIWGMVSVTDNITQEVEIITPQ